MINDLSSGVGASKFDSEFEEGNRADAVPDGAGVEVRPFSWMDSSEGPVGVPECLEERRRDLVADGRGVESTPPRLVRRCCCAAKNGV